MQYEQISLYDWFFVDQEGSIASGKIALLVTLALTAIVALTAYFRTAFTRGPSEGVYLTFGQFASIFQSDLRRFSPRRITAIAWLLVQEAIRARVWVAVVVFFVILMFAAWFLNNRTDHPLRQYVSLVVFGSNALVFLTGLFLSTLSLPNDIERRTIYTVATKPVSALEMTVGRFLGFLAIGTAMLLVMAPVGYLFIVRSFQHTHEIRASDVQWRTPRGTAAADATEGDAEPASATVDKRTRGRTTEGAARHSHLFVLDENGKGTTERLYEHEHEVERVSDGGTPDDLSDDVYRVGPPQGLLVARVPRYGQMVVRDRMGQEQRKGINVGYEWEYRGYIDGASPAEFEWTFENVDENDFPEGLPLEMTIRIFRTYKGNIEKTVLGRVYVRSGDNTSSLAAAPILIRPTEYEAFRITIPRKLERVASGREGDVGELDLYRDLAKGGRLKIALQCMEPGQYYGAARADLYIRGKDASFAFNYFKTFFGVWLQFATLTAFGVMFSTFLKGPIALLSTVSLLFVDIMASFVREVASGVFDRDNDLVYQGGGPIESMIRLFTQANQAQALDINTTAEEVVKGIDKGMMAAIWSLTYVFPDLTSFDMSTRLAYGYDIDGAAVLIATVKAIGYVTGATLIGYLIFKNREVAA